MWIFDEFPILDQSLFPPLPPLDVDGRYVCPRGFWTLGEQAAISLLISACSVSGKWMPIAFHELEIEYTVTSPGVTVEDIRQGLWNLRSMRMIQVGEYNGIKYVIPDPEVIRSVIEGNPTR